MRLILGMLAGLIHESGFLSEPLFALLAGVLLGPGVFDLLDLAGLGEQAKILEAALVGVALRLPVGYISSNWRLLVVLLGILMLLMWLACSLLTYLFLGVSLWVALLIVLTRAPGEALSYWLAHGLSDTPLTKLYGTFPRG